MKVSERIFLLFNLFNIWASHGVVVRRLKKACAFMLGANFTDNLYSISKVHLLPVSGAVT